MKKVIVVVGLIVSCFIGIVFAQVSVKHIPNGMFSRTTSTSISKAVNGQFVQTETTNTVMSCSMLNMQLNRAVASVQTLNSEIKAAGC